MGEAAAREVLDFCTERRITTVRTEAPDLDGVVRGKRYSVERFAAAVRAGSVGWSQAILAWDLEAHIYGNLRPQDWMSGYFGDVVAVPDLATLAVVPWEPGTAAIMVDLFDIQGRPIQVAPRTVLRAVDARLAESGIRLWAGVEIEFVLLEETPSSLRAKGWRDLRPADPGLLAYSLLRASDLLPVLDDIRRCCEEGGIGLEAVHTEPGPGMVEANLTHRPLATAADQAMRFKLAVKQVARRHGLLATFMAAWSDGLSGCGAHLHLSAWSADDQTPLFASTEEQSQFSGCCFQVVAGQLATLSELSVLFNPTVNSFKRCLGTPAAPRNCSWGVQNRTAALRLIPAGSATRIEHRRSGADCNVYLALAGCAAGALHGLEERLTPPPEVSGNAYESGPETAPSLPRSLREAVPPFRGSQVARRYLGDAFVDHFADSREWEVDRFERSVTDWEVKRYLEQI